MSADRHLGPLATPLEQDLAAAFLELQPVAETEPGGSSRSLPLVRDLS
jgi:hypothetical protein